MKFISITILIFCFAVTIKAQIPNTSFEQWSGGEPLYWYTSNDPLLSPGTINVTQSSDSYEGSYAVKGEVVLAYDTLLKGMNKFYPKVSSYGFEDSELNGYPISGRPKMLRGYVNYQPQGEGGYFNCSMYLSKWVGNDRQIVGSGGIIIFNTFFLDSTYREFEAPFSYYFEDDPDSIFITFNIGSGDVGSIFYLDDISLSYYSIISPAENEIVIAGEKDTIEWDAGTGNLNISYSLDEGSTYHTIINNYPADSGKYVWDVPEDLISSKALIRIEDPQDNSDYDEQPIKIKPYIITRLDADGDYIAYDINTDRWGFGNDTSGVWSKNWWSQFDYSISGTDPFTGKPYPANIGSSAGFATKNPSDFPDWISFVNTFGTGACYLDLSTPVYSPSAVAFWNTHSKNWNGSCFGIAISNALAFQMKGTFLSKYTSFPDFSNPINVNGNADTYPVVSELFSHQFGKIHLDYRGNTGLNRTPTQTVNDMKTMFKRDNVRIRTLSFNNNGPGGGGHAILVYKLKKDPNAEQLYHISVYDNSYPNVTNAEIIVDTSANGGAGSWSPQYAWTSWGGSKWFYLRDFADYYLSTETLPKSNENVSPFILDGTIIQIYQDNISSVKITDQQNNSIGFMNNQILNQITDADPLIVDNGSTGPPLGYELPAGNYSMQLNDFKSDTISLSVFDGNKSFILNRTNTTISQTDKLFFDGGLSAANPDPESKSITLTNIINESVQEKVFTLTSLDLIQYDSVKVINPDDNELDLISYGSEKNYGIDLALATKDGLGMFRNSSISLKENSTHKLIPDWGDFNNLKLKIYVDDGNDGSIDDTLEIQNQITSVEEDEGSLLSPDRYQLAQNYPNPFNPTTKIQYSLPQRSKVVLKVYDILGNEVITLVNEEKPRGVFTVTFDGSAFASGIYLYKLQAGSFVETKKMLLVK